MNTTTPIRVINSVQDIKSRTPVHAFAINKEKFPFIDIKHGDCLRVGYNFYSVGTLVGYSRRYNECPYKAIEQTEKAAAERPYDGHRAVWINADASVIDCSGRSAEEKAMSLREPGAKMHTVEPGKTVVHLEGHLYRIVWAPNHNLHLDYVDPAEVGQGPKNNPE